MRNYFRLFVLMVCVTIPSCVYGYGSAWINKVWFETNAQRDGENGVRVHVDFNAEKVKNHSIRVTAYFYYSDKEKMYGGIKGYKTTDGQVCVGNTVISNYDNSHWKDFRMFIPKRALNLSSGTHSYLVKIKVRDVTQDELITKVHNYHSFMVTGGGGTHRDVERTDGRRRVEKPSIARKYRKDGIAGIFTIVTVFKNGYEQHVGYVRCLSCRGATVCNPCGGTGYCSLCQGKGGIITGGYGNYIPCTACNQTGRCRVCSGTGKCFCNKGEYPGYKISTSTLYDQDGRVVSSLTPRGGGDDSSPSRSDRPRSSGSCSVCGGTGIDPNTSADGGLSSWFGYYNDSDSKCPYCSKYGSHSHSRCAHCNVPRQ